MLARRFTMICLTMAIFGMVLANVVAENGSSRFARMQAPVSCDFAFASGCSRPVR